MIWVICVCFTSLRSYFGFLVGSFECCVVSVCACCDCGWYICLLMFVFGLDVAFCLVCLIVSLFVAFV